MAVENEARTPGAQWKEIVEKNGAKEFRRCLCAECGA